MSRQELLAQMAQSVVDGDVEHSVACAQDWLAQDKAPLEAIQEGYVPGLNRVGDLYECGEYFLPELVMSAEAMKAAVKVLEPELRIRGESQQQAGRVIIGSVEGDIHDIGKTLVAMMLGINGYEVVDLGVDVQDRVFVEKAQELQADMVALSALLTTTMLHQRRVIEMLQEAGLRGRIKVIVGGSPVTEAWAQQIGADGYAGDAVSAVRLARRLTG